ncbi:hypothetical protein J2Z21_009796 [Streptomyces griseochromogenes]|uniref:Uncharacterized protein n=1 Tax=Streptomyces griseochromogenes TaxID=68214 RepID=A0ABS4MBG9_9ACTN|nr:hypothetical protein [Streptomyces griseochromogenes]MBP2056777.1 hypothetical protein [Streptomyces griseochromogenes]
MGDEKKLIDPSGIPHFIGDLATLDTDVMLLTADAGQFRASGSDVHTEFQGLSAFYKAPEAEQLFATTLPVKQKSDAFADDLEKVASALSEYSTEVQPLVKKLDALKADATAFVNSVAGDDHWRKDQDKVDHNNDLWHDVNHTVTAFQDAERAAYNKIMALIGGTRLTADDGSHGENMYGFRADDLDHAKETPWGAPAEREYEGWAWLAHQGKQVWDGVWHDGVIGTVNGLGTLFGADGGHAAGEAWKSLAKLSTASGLTGATMGAWWLVPEDKLPSWLRDARTVHKEAAKGFVAYDQWKTNPARAAGAAGFNILTVVGTEGAGAAVSGAGKAGAATRALSVIGKVSRAADPMTYVGKAGKFAFVKVGDTFTRLKNLQTGAYLDLPEKYGLPESARRIPEDAIPDVDAHGNTVYLTTDGHILNADGSLRQRVDAAAHELSANDHGELDAAARDDHSHELVGAGARAEHGADATRPGGQEPGQPGRNVGDHEASSESRSDGPSGAGSAERSGADGGTGQHGSVGARHSDGESQQSGHTAAGAAESSSGHSRDIPHGTGAAHSHTSVPAGGGGDDTGLLVGGDTRVPDGPMEPRGNLVDGSWEGPQGLRLSPEENAATEHFMRRALATEPRITDAIEAAAGHVEHGKLNGLEYRLKGEDSLKRKVATALLEDVRLAPERALANIRDSLRYTVEIPTKEYSHGVQQAVGELRARGFENVTFKNTWGGSGYKGINSTWRDPSSGQVFEVQFHTPESFVAKMDTHVLYEKGRLPGISSDEFSAIQAAQNDLFDKVPVPRGADSISLDHDLHGGISAHAHDADLGRRGDESVHGNGPPPELTPEQRAAHDAHLNDLAQHYSDDFDQLKQDPDHKGKVKPSEMDEARVALDLREDRKVPTDIRRPPGANQGDLYSPSTGEFYDIKGVHSDWPPLNNVRDKTLPFKGAYDPANNQGWVRKLEDQIVTKGRMVILDMRNANQAAIDDVKSIVEQHGWSDRVVWYP